MENQKDNKELFDSEKIEKIINEMKKITDEMMWMAKSAKRKYERLDDKTKDRAVKGLLVGTAALIGTIGLIKFIKGRKKND